MEGSRKSLTELMERLGVGQVHGTDRLSPATATREMGVDVASVAPLARVPVRQLEDRWSALSEQTDEIETGLSTIENDVDSILSTHNAVTSDRDRLNHRVQDLEQTLTALRSSQDEILRRITSNMRENVVGIERVIAMTGLEPSELLDKQRRADAEASELVPEAQGGPFVELASLSLPPNDPLEPRVVALDNQLTRHHNMTRILRLLPLEAPVEHYRLTSGYGTRRDPIRKRLARHNGIDLANEIGTPILTPSPGRVVYAGWRGNFGRMVEIDHGLGIRTRYGHMKKILVERGQQLDYGEKIGLMGSSGRSTGSHLHYEIRVDGVPLDPLNFLKAGKYALRGQ